MIQVPFVDPHVEVFPEVIAENGIDFSTYQSLLYSWVRAAIRRIGQTDISMTIKSWDTVIVDGCFGRPEGAVSILEIKLLAPSGSWIYAIYGGRRAAADTSGIQQTHVTPVYGQVHDTEAGFIVAGDGIPGGSDGDGKFSTARITYLAQETACDGCPVFPEPYTEAVKAYIHWRLTYMARAKDRQGVPQSEVIDAERRFLMLARDAYAKTKMPSAHEIQVWAINRHASAIPLIRSNRP